MGRPAMLGHGVAAARSSRCLAAALAVVAAHLRGSAVPERAFLVQRAAAVAPSDLAPEAQQLAISPSLGGLGASSCGLPGFLTAAALCTAAAARRPLRGRATRGAEEQALQAASPQKVPAKPKKVRISAFDSIRFFLIAYIVCGHFITFAAPTPFATRAITQINVVVGAFFALSGYVAAYTTTETGERAASPKLLSTPAPRWILQRVFGYYPLHLLVLALFLPAFAYPDVLFNGLPTALWHGFLALTMTQAWFPMHAEIWNPPIWFLSALTFATAVLPFALPVLAKQTKQQLRRTLGALFVVGLLPKLGYCYDHNAWGFLEGAVPARATPSLAAFNTQRFNPFYALIEVLMGAAACRLVMLDGAEGEPTPKTNVLSTLLPLVGMVGIILLRAFNAVALSDLLTRAVIFIPLFLLFLMAAHRASVLPKVEDPLVKLLSSNLLVSLGNLAFPIFILHGPVGQLFYKKVIATKIWGGTLNVLAGPWFFYVYLGVVLAAARVVQKTFLASKSVGSWSERAVDRLATCL